MSRDNMSDFNRMSQNNMGNFNSNVQVYPSDPTSSASLQGHIEVTKGYGKRGVCCQDD